MLMSGLCTEGRSVVAAGHEARVKEKFRGGSDARGGELIGDDG